MTSKSEKDKIKYLQDKCMSVLNGLLRDEDNKYCVDCDSKGPRWASWNIGVFLCIRCAGIHRNLGVHISKVKSVNLDAWTPEQVVSLQQMGNSRARAVYEANLPDNFRRPQNDSSLETFIRNKYEHKKFIAREWVPPALPKVNWEKEIDDEIEKQKRKRKTTIEKKPLCNVEVPQLPKPKNPSPKPGRTTNVVQHTVPVQQGGDAKKDSDLLGLQNGEDSFSSFLSAPTIKDDGKNKATNGGAGGAKQAQEESIKSEEESFFNQTVPAEKEKVKLTKDSILALYGNAPPVVNNFQNHPFQNNLIGQIPATQYPANFPVVQQQQQGFPPLQNGMFNHNAAQFAQQQQQQQQQFPNLQQHQQQFVPLQQPAQQMVNYYTSTMTSIPSNNYHPNHFMNFQNNPVQFPSSQNQQFVGQLGQQSNAFNNHNQAQNPFFANQISLQQQFGSLGLNAKGGATNTPPAPTLTTNLFQ